MEAQLIGFASVKVTNPDNGQAGAGVYPESWTS